MPRTTTPLTLLLILAASLAAPRARADRSPILAALFHNDGEGFTPPAKNQALQALLAQHPALTFLEACGVGDTAEIARQLTRDPKLATTWTGFGWSALHLAAFSGVPGAVQLLLERGAEIDARARSKFKNTPLQAALLGRRDLVDLLLGAGAEINSRSDDGRTAVTEALRGKHAEIADYLRGKGGHGAEITANLEAEPKD
ncbi:MAG TPA: ankyrin repeat domain-containing protein [Kofleriaceae bacterium]